MGPKCCVKCNKEAGRSLSCGSGVYVSANERRVLLGRASAFTSRFSSDLCSAPTFYAGWRPAAPTLPIGGAHGTPAGARTTWAGNALGAGVEARPCEVGG